jgi:hypothetical protein
MKFVYLRNDPYHWIKHRKGKVDDSDESEIEYDIQKLKYRITENVEEMEREYKFDPKTKKPVKGRIGVDELKGMTQNQLQLIGYNMLADEEFKPPMSKVKAITLIQKLVKAKIQRNLFAGLKKQRCKEFELLKKFTFVYFDTRHFISQKITVLIKKELSTHAYRYYLFNKSNTRDTSNCYVF